MAYILALDQGTTSSRAIVFDHHGAVRAVAQQEFTQIFPQPGWVEHDATEIWATQSGVMHEALAKAGVRASDIAAIGITNQRETTVVWDRASGRPIANAIVWQDRRTAPMCDELRAAGKASLITGKTGLVIDAYFSGTKLAWLLDHVPGARERAKRGELAFGTIDSWLIYNLTGGRVHVTDASNASRTLLFDIRRGEWDDELLALLDVPRGVLPRVVASSGVCAQTSLDGVQVPIAGIAGDQQAALFGQACLSPGFAKNTYGTGCFLLMNTGTEAVASRNNLVTTVAWLRDGVLDYALEGSVFIAGAVVQWLRDGLQIIRAANEIEALARRGVRAHARDERVAPRACGARIDRVSKRGRARCDAEGCVAHAFGVARGWRRRGQRPVDAVPGGRARRARGAPEGARDDRARRRVSSGARGGLLAGGCRRRVELGGRSTLRARDAARARGRAAGRVGEGGGEGEGVGVERS
jgi:glycerol kinase